MRVIPETTFTPREVLMDPGITHESRTHAEARLKQYLEHENESLLRTLRMYVARANLTEGEIRIRGVAAELLGEVTVEALAHADRFDATRAPGAWLLGIAANLIRRRQVDLAKRTRREPLARDLVADDHDRLSDGDVFDQLAALTEADFEHDLEAREGAAALLAHVPEEDRQVLRYAVISELDGEALAVALGTSPGAARVRLHRALKRLRAAMEVAK
jgi:RNA polymerase sigma factor (sigma-70 family)